MTDNALPPDWRRLGTERLEYFLEQMDLSDDDTDDVIEELSRRDEDPNHPTDIPRDQLDYPHNQPPEA